MDRPEFQKLLEAVKKGEIRRVICYKLDRCSRSILDFANMMEVFQQNNVEFISCTEKFDTSTPMGRAMLNICIVFAQLERETIQQRVTDAYHMRSLRGFYMGGRIPYGFTLEPHLIQGKKTSRYCPCHEEVSLLQRIFKLYADPHTSIGDIVKYLEENKISCSRSENGRWKRSFLISVLKNPIYVKADQSVYEFFRSQGTNILSPAEDFTGELGCYLFTEAMHTRKDLSLRGHNLILAPHFGIIPADIWLRCRQKSLASSQSDRPIKAKNTWLAGKIKCTHCGYALVIRKWKGRRYYMCSRRLKDISSCEGVGGLPADKIEDAVYTALYQNITHLDCPDSPNGRELLEVKENLSCWETLSLQKKRTILGLQVASVFAGKDHLSIQWKTGTTLSF